METIFLNPKKSNFVAKPLAGTIFSILKDYTGAKNNIQLGNAMDIKSPQVAISQMKAGKCNLPVEKLRYLATHIQLSYEDLLGIVCEKMLVVEDKDKRSDFLEQLKDSSPIGGNEFHERINGQQTDFLTKGNFPPEWIKLVPKQEDRIRIIEEYCIDPEMLKNRKSGKKGDPIGDPDPIPPSPGVDPGAALPVGQETVKSGRLFNDINELQLISAISQAAQNAGETRRAKLPVSTEVLLGTIISQMLRRNYSVGIKKTGGWEERAKAAGVGNLQPEKEELLLEFQGKDGKMFSWKFDPQHFLTDKLGIGKKAKK